MKQEQRSQGKSRPIHIVKWKDHFSNSHWHDVEHASLDPMIITSVGYLTGDTDEVLALASTLDEQGQSGHTQTIMRSCVTSHEVVDFVKPKPKGY